MNKKYNKDLKPNYLNTRDGDIRESVCNSTKIKSILNMKQFIKFENGVKNIWK